MVKLVGGGSVRGGRDLPDLESIGEPCPVSFLPAGSGFVAVRGGRA